MEVPNSGLQDEMECYTMIEVRVAAKVLKS